MIDVVRMNSDEVCDAVRQMLAQAQDEDVLMVFAEWLTDRELSIEDLAPYLDTEEEG